jgi:hypothetical protein
VDDTTSQKTMIAMLASATVKTRTATAARALTIAVLVSASALAPAPRTHAQNTRTAALEPIVYTIRVPAPGKQKTEKDAPRPGGEGAGR